MTVDEEPLPFQVETICGCVCHDCRHGACCLGIYCNTKED